VARPCSPRQSPKSPQKIFFVLGFFLIAASCSSTAPDEKPASNLEIGDVATSNVGDTAKPRPNIVVIMTDDLDVDSLNVLLSQQDPSKNMRNLRELIINPGLTVKRWALTSSSRLLVARSVALRARHSLAASMPTITA